jgi:hypothetical protein
MLAPNGASTSLPTTNANSTLGAGTDAAAPGVLDSSASLPWGDLIGLVPGVDPNLFQLDYAGDVALTSDVVSKPVITASQVFANSFGANFSTAPNAVSVLLPSQFGVVATAGKEVLYWDGIQVTGPGSNTPATFSLTPTVGTLAPTVTSNPPVPAAPAVVLTQAPGVFTQVPSGLPSLTLPYVFVAVQPASGTDDCASGATADEANANIWTDADGRVCGYHEAPPPVDNLGQTLEWLLSLSSTNTSTGNFKKDPGLILAGRKLLLDFRASYNSLDAYTGPLGIGWTHTYNDLIIPNSGGAVVKEGDGQEIPFNGSGPGAFTPGIPGAITSSCNSPPRAS